MWPDKKDNTMTNEEVLQKAVEKAVKNGWNGIKDVFRQEIFDLNMKGDNIYIKYNDKNDPEMLNIYQVIFSHDFAKAFWKHPDDCHIKNTENLWICSKHRSWEYFLQQLVLEEDPIKYLEKFL
jgi:hypothetical protein